MRDRDSRRRANGKTRGTLKGNKSGLPGWYLPRNFCSGWLTLNNWMGSHQPSGRGIGHTVRGMYPRLGSGRGGSLGRLWNPSKWEFGLVVKQLSHLSHWGAFSPEESAHRVKRPQNIVYLLLTKPFLEGQSSDSL